MALVKPFIFQVVGYQNRGKTTFITNLIKKLREAKLETAVLKHHGHGGKPDVTGTKDSNKHFLAGAAASLVEGDGTIELLGNFRGSAPITELIQLLCLFLPDVILIEGYKQEDFPKVILIKEESDLPLLERLTNVKAAVAWPEYLERARNHASVPVFPLDSDQFITWFLEQI
ncbi:molybdopterin-guanine dinucleotide biosynthesis protein B [Peribacillus simplex]|uniref:molybdopterin-guanine dinucleotide biosynthesis protein B n=1 Tax=Peribacillus TaxID=2675229 RepID=UPI00216350FB|nr:MULTISPECIES: molybdopterin-guanine dinucleotide biosynthesis protein B [Peribacillus]MBX9955467.1 molybdopterin-guanine dinucleotide biosynthesis protein B [Peribacillus simplex]